MHVLGADWTAWVRGAGKMRLPCQTRARAQDADALSFGEHAKGSKRPTRFCCHETEAHFEASGKARNPAASALNAQLCGTIASPWRSPTAAVDRACGPRSGDGSHRQQVPRRAASRGPCARRPLPLWLPLRPLRCSWTSRCAGDGKPTYCLLPMSVSRQRPQAPLAGRRRRPSDDAPWMNHSPPCSATVSAGATSQSPRSAWAR